METLSAGKVASMLRLAELVEEVTDDKALEKDQRKRLQVEHAAEKSRRAKILKLADKTSNLRSVAASPPPSQAAT
jgi:GTP diphosphokinase / guanosine-3',5'-bis(diphosphate) 3'-diphosphatase